MPKDDQGDKPKHSHPGGSASILGVKLARMSGMQGVSLLITNALHYLSIVAVGAFLGPRPLGDYALLFFLTGLVTQLIHLATKSGTIRRTFGVSDDDDDDVEGDEAQEEEEDKDLSKNPPFTLGVGIVWCSFLCVCVIIPVAILHTQIAQFLLGDPRQGDVVILATITGAVWALFKMCEIVLWFERKPLAYTLVDASRPAINLIAIIAILAGGAGVKGAVVGQVIGTVIATLLCLFVIRHSFELGWDWSEIKAILRRGAMRVPIASSMWVIQNSDVFLLSRFVDHYHLGLYNMASRTGFMVSFLPQGFRVALRPMRRSATFKAFKQEYGTSVAQGQMLAYFVLLSMTAILSMLLAGQVLLDVAAKQFASAAPLIPLTACAMVMPALYRTISGMSVYPRKRLTFIISTIFAALAYVGFTILIVPKIGIYGAPVSMILAFSIPSLYMFLRSQLSSKAIDFPYIAMVKATAIAVAIWFAYHKVHPSNHYLELAAVVPVMGLWVVLLFAFRVIPTYHREPLLHMARSLFRGSVIRFNPKRGLGAIEPEHRSALHDAIFERLRADGLQLAADGNGGGHDGARIVKSLRKVGRKGGVPVGRATDEDDDLAYFLFAAAPPASRQVKMLKMLSAGIDSHDVRTLEDLVDDLRKAPPEVWGDDVPAAVERRRSRRFPRLRRA
jgi:O-antigen/teichoic acid export membrane protein